MIGGWDQVDSIPNDQSIPYGMADFWFLLQASLNEKRGDGDRDFDQIPKQSKQTATETGCLTEQA